MSKETIGYSVDALEINENPTTPTVDDFVLVKLNGKPKLMYISDVSKPVDLPEDVKHELDDKRDGFSIVYNVFDENYKSKTPIYRAITSLSQGEKTTFKIQHGQEILSKELELIAFWGREQKETAFAEFDESLKSDDGIYYVQH